MRLHWRQFAIAALLGLMLSSAALAYLLSPPTDLSPLQSEPRLLEIARGSTFKSVASTLESNNVIRSALAFEILALLKGERSLLKSGEYEFPHGIPATAVLANVVAGKVKTYQITLVEGWTLRQCLQALAMSPGLTQTLTDVDDPKLLALLQSGASSAEGLFDANTYRYVRGDTDLAILERAHTQLSEKLAGYWDQRAQRLLLATPYEALILASIVEKETGLAAERAKIAGVFYNRIISGMRLQSDPTTIYGLGDRYTGTLTRDQLREETPYNTYRIDGLPPTPIALVSDSALKAVLKPELHDYYYFVSNSNGGHVFSRTLEEHNAAVAIYRAALEDSLREIPPQADTIDEDNSER
ncbi:MAG: endolytic transglycosylase MltG [Pseudomonadales bacterium]|nr:endolytic transglycosylase MltG [Pseudomonadales bacterium]